MPSADCASGRTYIMIRDAHVGVCLVMPEAAIALWLTCADQLSMCRGHCCVRTVHKGAIVNLSIIRHAPATALCASGLVATSADTLVTRTSSGVSVHSTTHDGQASVLFGLDGSIMEQARKQSDPGIVPSNLATTRNRPSITAAAPSEMHVVGHDTVAAQCKMKKKRILW